MSIDLDLGEELNALMRDYHAIRYKGKKVQFALKPHEHVYNYYRGKSGAQHCYTPHPSTDGDYFVWTYKRKKINGVPHMVLTRLVRCARRKVAREKALKRHYKDFEK